MTKFGNSKNGNDRNRYYKLLKAEKNILKQAVFILGAEKVRTHIDIDSILNQLQVVEKQHELDTNRELLDVTKLGEGRYNV